ncbi:MAG: hypothetical protein JOZ22_02575 [Acidobacteriia bacterium]|nr:hypothetical protein [Terriglobia bacterium]
MDAVTMARSLRTTLDEAGGSNRMVLVVGDNSFCNRRVLRAELDRVTWLVRARKDAVLCFRAPAGGRRISAKERFTPESVRQDKERNWKQTRIGGMPASTGWCAIRKCRKCYGAPERNSARVAADRLSANALPALSEESEKDLLPRPCVLAHDR